MKKRTMRVLALLLAVVMTVSMLPSTVLAVDETQTYTKVTTAPEDWSGTYLIVSEGDKLIMDGSRDQLDVEGNKVDVTITDGKITGDYAKYSFTIAPMEGGYSVKSASGKYIYGAADKNKLNTSASPALNTITFENGNAKIASEGSPLQYNNNASNGTRFRYYYKAKQQPISLYKLDASAAQQVATPTASPAAGEVAKGTEVTFSCATEGATISYATDGKTFTEGTKATVNEAVTFTVKATKTGMTDSNTATFAYTVKAEEPETVSIATALAGETGTSYTVKGVVTLVDGKNIYIQDATGGIDLYLSAATTEIALGDTVIGTGALKVYNGLPELDKATYAKSSGLTLTARSTTIGALTTSDVCTYVAINGVEVTEVYDKDGQYTQPNITVKDADGKTIQLYKAVINKVDGAWEYKVGDKLDITAAVGIYGEKLQLRNTKPEEVKPHSDVYDPISDDMIPEGALNVKQAAEQTSGTITVVGQVVYHYGKAYNGAASIDSIILEDVIDGEIYGYQVYDYTNYAKYVVGDVVKVTGTASPYGGVPQLKPSGAPEVLKSGLTPIAAQEITVSQMGADYLSEYVYIKDVTLGTYNASASTTVTDATGTTNLFKGVPLAANVKETDVVALYACCSAYNNKYQLRNGSSADYVTNTTPAPSGDLPKPGDKFVIYNQNAEAVLAAQNDTLSIEKAEATIVDGKAVPANGAVVFTVEQNGEYLRFKSDAYGYLCSNGTGNNAFYSKAFSEEGVAAEDADWLVRTCSGGVGGYEMESRTAKYNGRYSQWLEYYSDAFKTYSMYNVDDYTIYSFFFYPVADGVNVDGGLVVQPTITFPGTMLPAYVGSDYEFDLDIDTILAIDDPWIEYSVRDEQDNLIGGVQGNTDVEVLDGFTTGKGKVHITVFDTDIAKAAEKGSKMTLTFAFKDVKGNEARASYTVNILDEPVISNVTPAQGAETKDNKRPEISADITNAGENPTVTMTVNGAEVNAVYANGKVTYTPAANMEDGKVTVTVAVTRADGKKAEKTWSFTVGEAAFQLYFGQLHSHTQYSDGAGTLESALDYIKGLPDSANVDFVAFTDHSNYFDTTGAANPEGSLYNMELASSYSQQRWKEYKDAVAAFNEANADMVAIAGFEMTWSGGPGHINTFNTPGIVSRNNSTLNNKTDDAGMKAYYALLSQPDGADSISQFNHPGTTFGTFKDFAYWDPVIDSRMYMVEVGNGEGQIGAGGYYPSYSEYIKALDKGWHLAPSNNQDNHKGRWGNANDARDVILTDDFSEAGIYAAIRAMRMYATEDKNLEIGYTVNGEQLGSIITEVPEKLNFNISFHDPDNTDSIAKVELVVNSGKVAYTWDTAAELAKGEVSVELDPAYSYYFVRITEGDGDIAVTAPVWVGESLKLGISSAECGTATPVTNEELTITTTLFNSESADAAVKSVTYTVNGVELEGTKGGATVVPASGTAAVTFQYTPTAARVMTVTVTVVMTLNGEDYTFTKDVALDVLDASKLVYIGIDASHYNEYVAGNYKDSMGNFGNLAAEYSVRTVQLNTSDELVAACGNPKYKAIILTAPSRRLAAAQENPKTYSAAELNALKAFNEAGGMVILAGWSDNYENYDVIQNNPAIKHMAATQNEVLAALGSSLRISDDATYDDVRSAADGVDKWRLYFSTYNMDNPLLDGVIFDAEHPYDKLYTERFSHYGGASIYAVDANGTATSTLPATVSPVVYGHASTYSVDVDNDGLGGDTTPKYAYADGDNRLMVMAAEQLEGKGLIVVSGAAFMSNFEVQYQASDNGAEKNYSNYKICQNLVSMLNQTEIDKISAVQAEPDEGVKFTIEGVVTSNASGYDKDTAFFDCIYVQDDTAGINAFPVAGNFKIGDKVRITGTTSSYQGERQLAVTKIEKVADAEAPAPKDVTAAQVNDGSVLGSLVRIKGTITRVEEAEGKIQTIMVKDAAGNETRIFIDGYITTGKEVQNAVVGNLVEAVGLASYDNTFVLSDGTPVYPRIRIRDRADVVCTEQTGPVDPGETVWNIKYVTDGGVINGVYPTTYVEGKGAKLPTSVTKKGCTFLGWYTADGERITQISEDATGDVTVYARWMLNALVPSVIDAVIGDDMRFNDVSRGDWFYKDVEYVYNKGIMDGVDRFTFAPNANLTRAMIVTILYRIEGEPVTRSSSDFTDVDSGLWYTKAVAWAASKDIVNGYGNGKFGPNDFVTREQLAAILYRYTAYKGESTAAVSGNLNHFTDTASVSAYAVDAMNWAVGEGLINGSGDKLMPRDNATRAQVAAIIHRYLAG